MAGSAEIVVAHGLWQFLLHSSTYLPVQISVIGAAETGKTTLDRQLTTRGEIRELGEKDRTHHSKSRIWGTYKMPEATKKRVKSSGLLRTVVSRDLGGHIEYHSTWLRDMIERRVSTVVVVIDHRHMEDERNVDNQTALGYLVEGLARKTRPKGLSLWSRWRGRKYAPKRVLLIANKADEWMDEESYEMWNKGFIARHAIYDVFREDMYRLQSMHIPVYIDAVSARYGWNVEDALVKGMNI
jgi:hypothetical protein